MARAAAATVAVRAAEAREAAARAAARAAAARVARVAVGKVAGKAAGVREVAAGNRDYKLYYFLPPICLWCPGTSVGTQGSRREPS